jgi:hypothetical protein
MKSSDYVAVRRLWARRDGRMVIVASPGQSCADVAPESLGWLLAKGWIAKAPAVQAKPSPKPKGKE